MINGNKHGFKALLTTQFLGAFNDNAFKFVIAALVVDLIDQSSGGTLYCATLRCYNGKSISGTARTMVFCTDDL